MDQQIKHYRIIRKVGAGGMGEVYLAEDPRLERQVAIKLLAPKLASDEDHRRRFLREARAASSLNHPNACTIHEVDETEDGRPYLAMEYIEGQSLSKRLEAGSLPIPEIVSIATQVVDALDAAHDKGIVHRDIKPDNICINQRGQVKILDFGLAKSVVAPEHDALADATQSIRTLKGTVLGTPFYMSPEQAMGKSVDHRSDLFSLGVVLYQLLTGRLPFAGASFAEIVSKIVNHQPEAIARFNYEVPEELERITLKCLAKDANQRFQLARELLIDLRQLGRSLDAPADAPTGAFAVSNSGTNSAIFGGIEPVSDVHLAPEELAKSDVLITYSQVDNQSIVPGQPGWITQFHHNLGLRVAQLSGRQVAVGKQDDAEQAYDEQILQNVPKAKTVVSVLSPLFIRSTNCQRLVETFWKSAEETGQFEINNHSRIVNVVKTPVEASEVPSEIQPLFSRLVPYEFYDRDPATGRLREFDGAFGETAKQRFYERVYDVAFEISQVLKQFGVDSMEELDGPSLGKKIYLAATTSDLEPYRDQLRRELTELGHEILPKQPLPLVASELEAVVRGCLEHCDMAIHFVGEFYGLVPEATDLSVVALQNQVAAEISRESNLSRLVWFPKGQSPKDERQIAFIEGLERDPEVHAGAELIVDTLENLKVLLRTRWQREKAAADNQTTKTSVDGPPRVYVICDQRDEEAIEPLEDFFYEQGIEVSLPEFEMGETEVQEIHIRQLRDCDAALVYYGAAGKHWVDFNVRDLQKAVGYRESVPIPVSAIYLAPPFDRRKERFKSVAVDVIRQEGDQFDPQGLAEFARQVKQAKEATP